MLENDVWGWLAIVFVLWVWFRIDERRKKKADKKNGVERREAGE